MEPSRKQLTGPQSSLFGSHMRLRDNWGQVYENKRAGTHRGPIKKALLAGVRMSLIWISKAVASCIEEEAMSLSVFYYCICDFPRRCCSFEPTSCHLMPIHLFYVAISRPCCLSEFYPNRASLNWRFWGAVRLLFSSPKMAEIRAKTKRFFYG